MNTDVLKLIGVMAAAYPNTQISAETIKVYESMLKDIPLEILTASIQQCMAESDFIPSVASIRKRSLELTQPRHISALEAWGLVKQEMGRVGYYRSPRFDDPLIAKAVDCIGWQSLCTSENEPADRAHFSKVYESLVRRDEEDARALPMFRRIQEGIRGLLKERSMSDAA